MPGVLNVIALANEVYSVLLADDSDDDRTLFRLALRKVPGMRLVGSVQDGDQAIAYLAGRNEFADRQQFPYPDVLFLDLKMPRVTGFEVLTWLQHKEHKPFITVFSGSEIEVDMKRAFLLGADTYKVKPTNSENYAAVLKSVHEQVRSQRVRVGR